MQWILGNAKDEQKTILIINIPNSNDNYIISCFTENNPLMREYRKTNYFYTNTRRVETKSPITILDQKSFPSSSTPTRHAVEPVAVIAAVADDVAERTCDVADRVGMIVPLAFDVDGSEAED
jgi:hypothetical protein